MQISRDFWKMRALLFGHPVVEEPADSYYLGTAYYI